jgi:polysaccharide export outer membrane protein
MRYLFESRMLVAGALTVVALAATVLLRGADNDLPAKKQPSRSAAESSSIPRQWPADELGRPLWATIATATPSVADSKLVQCQALGPAAPHPIAGVDCVAEGNCGEATWESMRLIHWQSYAQGEYVGHAREAHVPEYRLRVDDLLSLVYRVTRDEISEPYQLNVGDELTIESVTDRDLNRSVIVLPDGTITLKLLGQVRAAKKNVTQLRDEIEQLYTKYYPVPAVTVTPIKVNTQLEDLRATVDSRFGFGGQTRSAKVTPEGTIALPAIGSVWAQGLTLGELKREIDARYAAEIQGIEVTPVLEQRAPRYVFVVGEVKSGGRFTLEGPTTSLQAIALAGGWNIGANLRQVIVFRRADDWRLIATMLDLRGALYGHSPCPADEIWLNDSDIVVVPKSPVLVADDMINLLFTRGLYGVVPFQGVAVNFAKLATI